jgi:hypothetical protein
VGDSTNFSRLSDRWCYWAPLAGLANTQVSWAHSDRGQLHIDSARFTTYDLVEKYLTWQWSSAARNALRRPRIGPKLYSLGHNSNVQFTPIKEGMFELRVPEGRAVLMEPAATIFSHLMRKPFGEIEELVKRRSGLR